MSKFNCCTACNETCYSFDKQFLSNLSLRLNKELVITSQRKVDSICYGFDCPKDIDTKINKLTVLKNTLDRYKSTVYCNRVTCLCNEDFQDIVEAIITEVGSDKCENYECKVDDSNLELWTLSNPACVSYDSYERYAKEFCGNIGLEISIVKEQCEVALAISREIITNDILVAVTAYKEACELNYELTRTDEQCNIEWKLLIEENNCDIEYKVYRELINCNVNFDIIKAVYSKGLEINQNSEGELVLKTPYSSHKLADLVIKNVDTNKYLLDYK